MVRAEWFFDVVSPFAYLQLSRMAEVEVRAQIRYTPLLLAGLLDHWGQKGPAEIPAKRRALYRFVQWQAERAAIPLKFPPTHPFNPIRALRLVLAADCRADAVRAIFEYLWAQGRSIEDETAWRELCAAVGVHDVRVLDDPSIKAALRQNGERAIAAQVFGVPTFRVDEELFWGYDSTDLFIDYLDHPERFRTGEHARLGNLPIGAQRAPRSPPGA